jgi:hypothetical protein
MEPKAASGDITTLILATESHRRDMEKTSGVAGACNEALRRLHEALERERASLQAHGLEAQHHSANIGALKSEITRITALAGNAASGASATGHGAAGRGNGAHAGFRSFPRSKGRRTMGRSER